MAERAFDLEPSRSAAASHLSSRIPDSDSLTRQFWSFIADNVTIQLPRKDTCAANGTAACLRARYCPTPRAANSKQTRLGHWRGAAPTPRVLIQANFCATLHTSVKTLGRN